MITPIFLITLIVSIPIIIFSYNAFNVILPAFQNKSNFLNLSNQHLQSTLFFTSFIFISLSLICISIISNLRKLYYKPKLILKDYNNLTYKQKFLRLVYFTPIHIFILYYTLDYFIALIFKQTISFNATNFLWCGGLLLASVVSISQTAINFIKYKYKNSD